MDVRETINKHGKNENVVKQKRWAKEHTHTHNGSSRQQDNNEKKDDISIFGNGHFEEKKQGVK